MEEIWDPEEDPNWHSLVDSKTSSLSSNLTQVFEEGEVVICCSMAVFLCSLVVVSLMTELLASQVC